MEALTDAVGLRMAPLCSGMLDVVHTKVKLVIVCFQFAAVFRPPVSQDTDNLHVLWGKDWQNAVIQKVNPDDGRLGGIQFGYHPLRVGIHESLLINVAHSLDCAHIKSVLGYRDSQDGGSLSRWMLIILLFTFQSLNLCFGQHQSLFSGHFFQNGPAAVSWRQGHGAARWSALQTEK